jgi:hypothetical protein
MAEGWKTIRVFISSTFRDMQAERDHLVRFVFPRLREELLKRRIHMVDVDLRWGVTSDQDAFELCMDEIDRCHPRFLCMLGGRFGWVPPPREISADFVGRLLGGSTPFGTLTSDQQGLFESLYARVDPNSVYRLREKPKEKEAIKKWNDDGERVVAMLQRAGLPAAQSSITASEIHYGALDKLDKPAFRYFYFRDPAVTQSIPEPHASDYREPAGSFAADALESIKQRIRDSQGKTLRAPGELVETPLPFLDYSCAWDQATARITKLDQFGERVYAHLISSIDAEFGTAPPPTLDAFAEENAAMDAFIENRVERYIVGSREPVFKTLLEHAEGSDGNGILCVVGDPGSGKSALLGKFYRDYLEGVEGRGAHPDQIVIPHFVGASAASTNVRQLLRRLCHELAASANITDEIPDDYDKLREAFPAFLEKAAAVKHVVILIDAINQLDVALQAHSMRWLPDALPPNARIILTALPGPALKALRARKLPPVEVPLHPLNESDSTAIMDGYLARYRKNLDAVQRTALLAKKDAGVPLYLLTALEELRTLGTYEEITQRIRELPDQVQPLFTWILERLERDPGFRDEKGLLTGEDLVRQYCSYIAIGRSGMAQAELVDLIAPAVADKKIPADALGNVAALHRLLRPYLMQRGELLDFFHGQLREAVTGKYLTEPEGTRNAHRSVASFFKHKSDPAGDATWGDKYPRGLSELPYHQTEAQMWDEVYATLTDLGFLESKCTHVAVVTTGSGENTRTVYGGVYELQEDYRHALERMPRE